MRYLNLLTTFGNHNQEFKMNRIKEVLEGKGIKQKWLADQLGKSYNMVSSYAKNRRQPSIEILFRIAEILNIDARELIVSTKLEKSK